MRSEYIYNDMSLPLIEIGFECEYLPPKALTYAARGYALVKGIGNGAIEI